MLWPSLYRASQAVAPHTLDELRPSTGLVALRCTLHGCSACRRFETSGRAAYERTLHATVLPWDCTNAEHRRLATDAGVDALPAYILIPPAPRRLQVVRPPDS